ncbi:LSU ribosomal protein L20p [Geomicrobium sp. JCM 19037]|nr:LSU ribosomal protein L20p [Geomicrobium sp. JCM 19037]
MISHALSRYSHTKNNRKQVTRGGIDDAKSKRWNSHTSSSQEDIKARKGYYGSKHALFRTAKQQVIKSGQYAYRDRRNRKREFRKLWIARINAAARINGLSYSRLMHGLKLADININRKMLADLAVNDKEAFTALADKAKAEL